MFGMNDPFGFDSHFNSIMNGFMMDPFGGSPFVGGQQQRRNNQPVGNSNNRAGNQLALRNNHSNSYDPFALTSFDNSHNSLMAAHRQAMGNPFALMNQMMGGGGGGGFNPASLFGNMEHAVSDPNAQVYSTSSVISYSNTGDGKPKVYQASSHTRQAGGVKETRQMVRDSEKGFEKVAVGHHIGDRAHIIERQKQHGGPVEEIVNLENLDDAEVNEFNKEFEDKVHSFRPARHHRTHHLQNNQPFAIEDASSRSSKKDRKSKSKSRH